MTMFDDEMTKAIQRHLAPDTMTALQNGSSMELFQPTRSITIPLRADVAVAYDSGVGQFVIEARCEIKEQAEEDKPPRWHQSSSVFSSRDLACAKDASAVVEYLFEEVKRGFIHSLVSGEIGRTFKVRRKE